MSHYGRVPQLYFSLVFGLPLLLSFCLLRCFFLSFHSLGVVVVEMALAVIGCHREERGNGEFFALFF